MLNYLPYDVLATIIGKLDAVKIIAITDVNDVMKDRVIKSVSDTFVNEVIRKNNIDVAIAKRTNWVFAVKKQICVECRESIGISRKAFIGIYVCDKCYAKDKYSLIDSRCVANEYLMGDRFSLFFSETIGLKTMYSKLSVISKAIDRYGSMKNIRRLKTQQDQRSLSISEQRRLKIEMKKLNILRVDDPEFYDHYVKYRADEKYEPMTFKEFANEVYFRKFLRRETSYRARIAEEKEQRILCGKYYDVEQLEKEIQDEQLNKWLNCGGEINKICLDNATIQKHGHLWKRLDDLKSR